MDLAARRLTPATLSLSIGNLANAFIIRSSKIRAFSALLRVICATVPLLMLQNANALADVSHAKEILKAMSDYMTSQKAISFEYDSTLEVVTTEGQKLALASSGIVAIQRPHKIHATRSGGFVDVEFFFDGTTLTLFGKNINAFTQVKINGTIDELVEELRYKYGRPLPAADLILSQPYEELMKDVTDIKDLGSGVIGGQECDFLAFRTEEVDWQIWIARGDVPYPCRYVITTKDIPGSPQYSIQVRNWGTGDNKSDFVFKNNTDATNIDAKDLNAKFGELPNHFSMGKAQ